MGGSVALAEGAGSMALAEAAFRAADTNGDGVVDLGEFVAAFHRTDALAPPISLRAIRGEATTGSMNSVTGPSS